MTAAPNGAARREILGRYGVRAPFQHGYARSSGHSDREAPSDQLAADLVEDLSVASSGLAGIQAFRDMGGGGKLLGLAEALHGGVDVSQVGSTGSTIRQGSSWDP